MSARKMYQFLATLTILFLSFSPLSFAQESNEAQVPTDSEASLPAQVIPATAHETVAHVSDQLIGMLDDAKQRFAEDPEKYFADFDTLISPWMDFGLWARGVMGKEYVVQATEEQIATFEQVFKKTLVETYAKGLVNIDEARYEVSPPREGDDKKQTVGVVQTLYSGSSEVQVLYAMRKNNEGRWQFRNVRLDGIDLGRTFRNQFKNAVESSNGDIDKVIAEWGA